MSAPAVIDRVKRNLVGLKMPRGLEILDRREMGSDGYWRDESAMFSAGELK